MGIYSSVDFVHSFQLFTLSAEFFDFISYLIVNAIFRITRMICFNFVYEINLDFVFRF